LVPFNLRSTDLNPSTLNFILHPLFSGSITQHLNYRLIPAFNSISIPFFPEPLCTFQLRSRSLNTWLPF
jgi:hypothetical protein